MKPKLLTTIGLATVMTFGGLIASADFVLTADDMGTAGTDLIIADNIGAGVFLPDSGLTTTHADQSGFEGSLAFSGQIGSFISTVGGVSKPLVGPPGRMNLSILLASDTAATMAVSLTDTGFAVGLPFDVETVLNGSSTGTVTSDWGTDLDDGHFSFASGSGSIGPFGPGGFSEESSIGSFGADPSLSLTDVVTVAHPRGSALTSLSSTVTIPEPATALLMVVAVPMLLRRR